MEIICTMGRNFKPEYRNAETKKKLFWKAKKDTYMYTPPCNYERHPILHTLVKAGNTIPYDDMKYGYCERDFELIEI